MTEKIVTNSIEVNTNDGSAAKDLDALAAERNQKARQGGLKKYRDKLPDQKKLFVRDRLNLLLDPGSFVEDWLLANWNNPELAADGVVIGFGKIDGRRVAVMANDSTVKAGSWGAKTVAKILHIQEKALEYKIPLFYLVDSAGARITDQVEMFPGERHAGRIFYNEVRMSGIIPQVCMLFGPSAAGGAYIPAFCDIVIMVEGNASMYLGSPRMAEMVIGEKVQPGGNGRGADALHRKRLRRYAGQDRGRSYRRGPPLYGLFPAQLAATHAAWPSQTRPWPESRFPKSCRSTRTKPLICST